MKYYFTFGSDSQFPYSRDDYVVVVGIDYHDCMDTYRSKHPDITENILNCAFYYTEKRWKEIESEYYSGVAPAEIIISYKAERAMCDTLEYITDMSTETKNRIISKAMNICDACNKGDIADMLMQEVMEHDE